MMRISPHRLLLTACYLGSLGALLYLAWEGWSYYATPLVERPRHELYWTLKPGGSQGRLYGLAGSAMMLLMLVYSLRKRWRLLRRWGALPGWLDLHIYLGTIGPLLVILHTSFKVRGLVALSFWSMIVVAASGVVGRFLYLQIPRGRAGDELSLAAVKAREQELTQRLRQDFRLDGRTLEELDAIAERGLSGRRSLPAALLALAADAVAFRYRLRRFRRAHRGLERSLRRRFERLVHRKALLHRRLLLWDHLRALFHYWHVLHKPFAVVMYVFMLVHVVVAWMTGYAWGG